MRAAHHHGLGLGPGAGDDRRRQLVAVGQESLAGSPELEREPRVDDVAAREAQVEVAALRPDRLRDGADEGDDIVVGRLLDLGDPLHVDARPGLERLERLGRDQAAGRLRPRDRELDP